MPFPEPLVNLIAQRFRALGEPARIRLLDALRAGPSGVSELAARMGLSQQNASKHLGILYVAGLVKRTRAGNSTLYAVSDPSVFVLCELVCDAPREQATARAEVLDGYAPRRLPSVGRTGE